MEKVKDLSRQLLRIKLISSFIPVLILVLILKEISESSFGGVFLWVVLIYLGWGILKFLINEIVFHIFIKKKLEEYYLSLFKELDFPEPEEYLLDEPEQYLELTAGENKPSVVTSIFLASLIQNYRGENFNIPALMRLLKTLKKSLVQYKTYKKLNENKGDEKNKN